MRAIPFQMVRNDNLAVIKEIQAHAKWDYLESNDFMLYILVTVWIPYRHNMKNVNNLYALDSDLIDVGRICINLKNIRTATMEMIAIWPHLYWIRNTHILNGDLVFDLSYL